jgi:hypothetical protein
MSIRHRVGHRFRRHRRGVRANAVDDPSRRSTSDRLVGLATGSVVGSGSIDEQDVKNVDSRETLILRDLLHHFTELRRQLNGKIGNALGATGLQDPGDDPRSAAAPASAQ